MNGGRLTLLDQLRQERCFSRFAVGRTAARSWRETLKLQNLRCTAMYCLSFEGLRMPDLPEQMEVGSHDNRRTQVVSFGDGPAAENVVDDQADGRLPLRVRLLINGRCDCPLLEIGHHFAEQVGCDQDTFSGQAAGADGPANRKAVGSGNVDSRQVFKLFQNFSRKSESRAGCRLGDFTDCLGRVR